MKLLVTFLWCGVALGQLPNNAQVRDPATEIRLGQAILQSRLDKDEAAFKAIPNPSPALIKAEHDMQLCFSVARSTEGMYRIPAGQGMKPNCDRQFIALETDVNQR